MTNNNIALIKGIDQLNPANAKIRGVARLKDGKLSLSIINLDNRHGEDAVVLLGFKNYVKTRKLPSLCGGEINVDEQLESIVVAWQRGQNTLPVACGFFSQNNKKWEEVVKNAQKNIEEETTKGKPIILEEEKYNDEELATFNYYEFEQGKVNEN